MSEPPVPSLRTYLRVWALLMLLLAASAASVYLPLGRFHLALNLAIAIVMALLVLAYFMDLKDGDALVRLAAAAGFFWLLLLIVLSLGDYLSRASVPPPW